MRLHLLYLFCLSYAVATGENKETYERGADSELGSLSLADDANKSSSWWHRHGHSSTRGGGDGGKSKNRTVNTSDSCASHVTCNSCNDASFCHWCEFDMSCHVMGSVHGCLSGMTCGGPPSPPKPSPPHPEDKNDTSCFSHKTCSDCALASHFCHWCGHDNSCHAIGSIHGCTVGVDCFSNDRCERRHSEPIKSVVFTQMGWGPFCVIVMAATLATACVCGCWCVEAHCKGAYDDLAAAFVQGQAPLGRRTGGAALPPDAPSSLQQHLLNATSSQEEEDDDAANNTHDEELPAGSRRNANHVDEYVRLVEGSEHDDSSEQNQQHPHHANGATTSSPAAGAATSNNVAALRLPHARRMYNACVFGNVVSLVVISAMSIAAVRYYPKIPEYNICNDSVAWSSLMQSLTSLKATADFEILASVSNMNHFDIVLDSGSKGTFSHNGVQVGTFDIPPVTATALSITDVLVVAHLAPEKWEALSLAAEYYRGVLVLDVDVTAHIRIPALFNVAVTRTLQDIEVQVNELSDRHLCACEDWDSAKNHTPHVLGSFMSGAEIRESVSPWLSTEKDSDAKENESSAFTGTESM